MNHKAAAKFQDDVYDISVTGRHVLVTDAMKSYAVEKIVKINRFNIRVIDVNVVMDIQKLDHRVDITLKLDHIFIKSSATSEDMYASIDKSVDRLQSQLRRYKTRITEHQLKGSGAIDMNVNIFQIAQEDELAIVNDEIESESGVRLVESYRPHQIVSRETRALKVLSLDEAMMKIELSGDQFLIFRSEEDQKLKVIYRRKDHNYGIIEAEK